MSRRVGIEPKEKNKYDTLLPGSHRDAGVSCKWPVSWVPHMLQYHTRVPYQTFLQL